VELIDDLLDVARIVQGRLRIEPHVCDVHEIINQAAELVQGEVESKKISLTLELKARNAMANCDATRIHQVIWNLLRNAVRFTPNGGRISVETHNQGDDLHISITDTGIGLKQEDLTRIFQAFEQAHLPKTPQMGLGLGLAIAANIISAHRGRIWAESPGEGKGATFHIALPAAATEHGSNSDEDSPSQLSRLETGLSILVVEDDDSSREALSRLLTNRGYRVETASSVAAARQLARNSFDLAICDIALPDGESYELVRELQQHRPMPAIALSGYGMEHDIDKSLASGFAVHLVKPVTVELLEAALKEALKARPARVSG
jgi:CheY-like chemotaxis protein/anti-sigma regulatory factor (Ser/Thr protein kinase)